MNIFQHIIRGIGELPNFGRHPGTGYAIAFIVFGLAGGANGGGWQGALTGVGLQCLWVIPIYLYGAYQRSVEDPPV